MPMSPRIGGIRTSGFEPTTEGRPAAVGNAGRRPAFIPPSPPSTSRALRSGSRSATGGRLAKTRLDRPPDPSPRARSRGARLLPRETRETSRAANGCSGAAENLTAVGYQASEIFGDLALSIV